MIDKVVPSFDDAVADIPDGAVIHFGGFASPFNTPNELIAALARQGATRLTAVSTWMGLGAELEARRAAQLAALLDWPADSFDLGYLAALGRIRHAITSFPVASSPRDRSPFERLLEAGEATVEVTGQGSLAERIRAARAGIAAFYTPVGPGTFVAEGKELRDFDGVPHVLEHALRADFALIRARAADRHGNLVYHGPRTFNQTMAGAATVTIAEVDEVVPLGALEPDAIHTPGVYVQRVVVRPREAAGSWREPR
jgi:3-oxoacid CoA-transferase A subunit